LGVTAAKLGVTAAKLGVTAIHNVTLTKVTKVKRHKKRRAGACVCVW